MAGRRRIVGRGPTDAEVVASDVAELSTTTMTTKKKRKRTPSTRTSKTTTDTTPAKC
jgi:hypothetical protein